MLVTLVASAKLFSGYGNQVAKMANAPVALQSAMSFVRGLYPSVDGGTV